MSAASLIATRIAAAGAGRLASLIIRLAVVSTALCVAVMIITSCLLTGFKAEIQEKVFGFWGHVYVAAVQSGDGLFEAVPLSLDAPWVEDLRALDGPVDYPLTLRQLGHGEGSRAGIAAVQTFIIKPGVIQTDEEIEGILLKGNGPEYDWSFFADNVRAGGLPDLTDSVPSREVLLSEQTADRVRVGVGDPFIIHFPDGRRMRKLRFTVGGLYRTGLEEYDTQVAFVDQRVLRELLGWTDDQVGGLELILDDARDMDGLAEYAFLEVVPSEVTARAVRERFPGIFEWLDLQNLNEYVIIGLMLVVCVINMTTALLILILERARMVGVLRTLGMAGAPLRRVFLRFGGRILVRGLLWGNAVGVGLCLLQKTTGAIRLSEENYYLSTAPIRFNWPVIAGINLGTLAVVLVCLYLPALLVTRIDPVKSIRFD